MAESAWKNTWGRLFAREDAAHRRGVLVHGLRVGCPSNAIDNGARDGIRALQEFACREVIFLVGEGQKQAGDFASKQKFFVHAHFVFLAHLVRRSRGRDAYNAFIERTADEFVDWPGPVNIRYVANAAAVKALASSAQSGYTPMMMRAGSRTVFAGRHHNSKLTVLLATSSTSSTLNLSCPVLASKSWLSM